MTKRTHDLVVFGATSFVGRILCAELLAQFGVAGTLRWAAAGRSREKLERLRTQLGDAAAELPLVVADATDEASLARLCGVTRVVVSTVGPYALHGEGMVQACTAAGTDYCDLTGEPQWIHRMIGRYQDDARTSGARLVPCCGFDSIPSDLGVLFLQRESLRRFGRPCSRVRMRVRAMRGGISGGTAASLLNVLREAAGNPALRRQMADPYLLCPAQDRPTQRQPNVRGAQFDADAGAWVAPFVMSAINTRVVLRSNALLDYPYGRDFTYDEAVVTGRGLKGRLSATGLTAGLASLAVAGALPPARWALERFVFPAPGEGPDPEARRRGFFDLRFAGTTADGDALRARVTGDRDPGYGSTARMLCQAAACLAEDVGRDDFPGGFWTPATLFGERLIERLRAHAGIGFEILED